MKNKQKVFKKSQKEYQAKCNRQAYNGMSTYYYADLEH